MSIKLAVGTLAIATLSVPVVGDEVLGYGFEFVGGQFIDVLYLLDSSDGSITRLGEIDTPLSSFDRGSDGRVIGLGEDDALHVVSVGSLSATPTGASIPGARSISHRAQDNMYYAVAQTGGFGTGELYSFDPDTGTTGSPVSLAAITADATISSFTFASNGNAIVSVFGTDDDTFEDFERFYSVNPVTGMTDLLFQVQADPEDFVDYNFHDLGSDGNIWTYVSDTLLGQFQFVPIDPIDGSPAIESEPFFDASQNFTLPQLSFSTVIPSPAGVMLFAVLAGARAGRSRRG